MKSYKQVLTFALILSMMLSAGPAAAFADAEETAAEETAEETAAEEEAAEEEAPAPAHELEPMISDEEALAMCTLADENDKFRLYFDAENERVCLQVKDSGRCWWSSPINAKADPTIVDKGSTMNSSVISQVNSSIAINVGDLRQEKKTELPAPAFSSKAKVSFSADSSGVVAEYDYKTNGVKFKCHYVLTDRGLHMYVPTEEIEEEDNESTEGKVLTKLYFAPYFGAVSSVDQNGAPTEGYMIVPDGSGALIRYNNGKGNYASYTQKVYGMDYTAVPLTAPKVTEQAYLPVMATVNGNEGLLMVASEGNANVHVMARVSGQNKQAYNSCNFMFEVRSTDEFFMNGSDQNKITVFEKYGINTPMFGVEFIPISDTEEISPADCAARYRDYLIETTGLTQKTSANTSALYVDTYGSVLKEESVLGLPVIVKKKLTTFKQAKTITDALVNAGADNIILNYNDWTKDSVNRKVATKAKPLGKLGSSKELKALANDNVTLYTSINNFTMEKGSLGYGILSNTAIRASSAYSRQSKFSPAFGVALSGVSPALIAPNTYVKIFERSLKSFTGEGFNNVGYGDWSTKLVGDYSKRNKSTRYDTMNKITEGYGKARESGQRIIAEGANSYIIPYADVITEVPVYSSGFIVTDEDIPFYQMVIHGMVPFSGKAVNGSSDTDAAFMRALAAGSDLNYDMIYEQGDELIDTDDDEMFYSHYSGWTETAGNQARLAKEILAPVSDYLITGYEKDGDVIRTTYSKEGYADIVIEVDTAEMTVRANRQLYDLYAEGAVDKGGAKD